MLRLTRVIGNSTEPALAEQLHALEHRGAVEWVTLRAEDIARHRLRAVTDRGSECAIILSRSERLSHGAVLLLEPQRAVVVRVDSSQWLRLEARDRAAALELGYLAGNLHWKVRFEGDVLWVRVEGDPELYRARLLPLLRSERIGLTFAMEAPGAAVVHEHAAHDHDHHHEGHAHDAHDGHAHDVHDGHDHHTHGGVGEGRA